MRAKRGDRLEGPYPPWPSSPSLPPGFPGEREIARCAIQIPLECNPRLPDVSGSTYYRGDAL
jgi:hypothetical protein